MDHHANGDACADFDSADKARRFSALIEIGRLPKEQAEMAVERLLALANKATDRQEFALVVEALGKVADERARSFLEEVLVNNLETRTGRLAARGLGAIGNPQSVPVLDKARNSPSHIVRAAANQALDRIGRSRK